MKLLVRNSLTALAILGIIATVGCGPKVEVGVGKDGGPYPMPKEASPEAMQKQADMNKGGPKAPPAGSQGTAGQTKPAGQ